MRFEDKREVIERESYDVIVAGGGVAGVSAGRRECAFDRKGGRARRAGYHRPDQLV